MKWEERQKPRVPSYPLGQRCSESHSYNEKSCTAPQWAGRRLGSSSAMCSLRDLNVPVWQWVICQPFCDTNSFFQSWVLARLNLSSPSITFHSEGKKKTCVMCSRYRESCGSADTLQGTERWCSTWAQQALGHPSMSELLHRHHVSCSQLHSRGLMLLSCTWICESSVQLLDCRACLTLVGFTVCPTLSAYVMGQLWSTYNLKLWGAYVLWLINMHKLIAIKTKNWVRWINTKDVHLLSYTKQYFLVLFSLGFNFLFV